MNKLLHYIALFFIITFAVMSGNLLSNFVTTWAAGVELQKMVAQRNLAQIQSNEIRQKQKTTKLQSDQIKRQNSAFGKTLAANCVEWLNMVKTTPTRITKSESKKRCDKYNTYVDTGNYKK